MTPCLLTMLLTLVSDPDPAAVHVRSQVDPGRVYRTVEALVSPAFEGRLSGSEGYRKSAQHVAELLKRANVKPLVPGYLQDFPSPYTKVTRLDLKVEDANGKPIDAKLFKDFAPMLFCGTGLAEGDLVFAGFGITSEALGWDDYRGLDVRGKVVMVLKGSPQARPGETWADVDNHRHRAENALKHGAAGLLYVYLPVANPNGDFVPGFPMAMVSDEFASRALATAQIDLKTLRQVLAKRQYASIPTSLKVRLNTESQHFPKAQGCNVLAWIPGSDPALRSEAVVLGAHLDHCGAWPVFMPGADDDAAGVAAVVEAARLLASSPVKPKRSIVFLLSGGEEEGMVGAKRFLAETPKEIARFRFMAFLDVMGAGEGVHVYGLRAERGREQAYRAIHRDLGLSMALDGDAQKKVQNGDHWPFQEKDIPAVAIFGKGPHSTYHTDKDDLFRFTPALPLEAAQFAALLMLRSANGESL